VLTRLYDEYAAAQDHYDTYAFHQVVKRLHDFCATDLSSLYLDIRKDALYCDATDADRRRSIQTVLYHLFHFLVTHLAPILSFTMHEAWATYGYEETVHKSEFYSVEAGFENAVIATKWNQIWDIRAQITKALESARADKDIGSSTDAHINLTLPSDLYEEFGDLDWAMLAITSTAKVVEGQGDEIAVEVQASEHNKCDRCWQRLPSVGQNPNHPDICERCVSVVQIERAAA
jgi:isoleucyl-tRNA synthetase